MALGDLRKTRSGSYTPREAVPFLVMSYVTKANQAGGAADPEDHVIGRLLRDALGIKAEFDANNNPVTEVKVYLEPRKESTSAFERHEIIDKAKGKLAVKSVRPNGIMRLDSASLDATHTKDGKTAIKGSWLVNLTHKYDPDIDFPFMGKLVALKPEGKARESNEVYQSAILLEADFSKVFNASNMRDMLVEAASYVGDEANPNLPGNPGFCIRAVERAGDASITAVDVVYTNSWDSKANRSFTPEEMVDNFLASEDGANWVSEVANAPATHFEVMPCSRLRTGKQSLPSMRVLAKNPNASRVEIMKRDDAVNFCMYPETRVDDDGKEFQGRGYGVIRGDVFANRIKTEDPEPGQALMSPWFRSQANPTADQKIYRASEFPSAVLPEEFAKVFEKNASETYKAARTMRDELFEKDAKKPENDAPDEAGPRP